LWIYAAADALFSPFRFFFLFLLFFLIDFGSLICGFNLLFWVGLKMIDECLMVVVMMF
jgi:hypothetical protein